MFRFLGGYGYVFSDVFWCGKVIWVLDREVLFVFGGVGLWSEGFKVRF